VTATLLGLSMATLLATPLDTGSYEIRYTGSLSQVSREGTGKAAKRFSMYCLLTDNQDGQRELSFLVDERGGAGWHWPERFGFITLNEKNQPSNKARIQLLHEHLENHYPLALQQPVFEHFDKIKTTKKFKDGQFEYQVTGKKKIKDFDCLQVEIATNFGRRQTLSVDQKSGLIIAAEQRVFMGQGDQFSLKMELNAFRAVDQERLEELLPPLKTLRQLQIDLGRKENEKKHDLNAKQLAEAKKVLVQLEKEADSTPFSRLASVINRDVKSQLQRTGDVATLAKKYLGKPAQKFELKLLNNSKIESSDLAGKIQVLHFWDYRGEPLDEPYGQVGYLDFLNSRLKKHEVKFIGVAVNPNLADRTQVSGVLRSVRKLKSFMNLSYDIALDDGSLLRKFGDPTKMGAKLPLWVVIDGEGKIVHYHVGFYKINPDEGLRELETVIVAEIKNRRK